MTMTQSMDAFGNFDEGKDEFVLQNPSQIPPADGNVQFPFGQQQ